MVLPAQVHNIDFEKYLQDTKIGLVDEFFKRFNGEIMHPDCRINGDEGRKTNLLLLFDLSKYKSQDDSLFIEASKMMDRVIEDSININYTDSTWFAIAHCCGELNKQEISFDLYLTLERRKDSLYKWVIKHATGDVFSVNPHNLSDRIMLYPDDHETNFISLMRMTLEQPFNVSRFLSNDFQYDATSVFTYLVYSGQLKISFVRNLEFVFTQIPEYVFFIENIERNNGNSGWLITKFYNYKELEKECLTSLLGIVNKNQPIITDTVSNISELPETVLVDRKIDRTRTLESSILINDYISFMQSDDNSSTFQYYKDKMIEMFSPSSNVILRDLCTGNVKTMSLSDFCQYIRGNKRIKIMVDALTIPLDISLSNIIEESSKSDTVKVAGSIVPIMNLKENIDSTQYLNMVVVPTEEGKELIPELGNLFITIVKEPKRCKKEF